MSQSLGDETQRDIATKIDPETERAVRAFVRRVVALYPVKEAILYGSRARGSHHADSDADVAVVLEGERGDRPQITLDMAGIAFDTMLETGVLVQALPFWVDDISSPEMFRNPALIRNILRDGLRV